MLASNMSPVTRTKSVFYGKNIPDDAGAKVEAWLHPLILCTAAARGDIDKVKYFVEEKQFDPKESDYDGRTPLHLACEEGHIDVVKYLVSIGVDVNTQDRWGNSPMRGALSANRKDISNFLKENGATLGISNIIPGFAAIKVEEKQEELQEIFAKLLPIASPRLSMSQCVPIKAITHFLKDHGIFYKQHPVVATHLQQLQKASGGNFVNFTEFSKMMHDHESILSRAFHKTLAIPDWKSFTADVEAIFESCRDVCGGKLADYIPELAEADPDKWGVSIMTVDGQVLQLGDVDIDFSVQSCGKPLLYSFCAESIGLDTIHKYVGSEPSGVAFNAFTLNAHQMPHNPFINAGAIMTSALFYPDLVFSKRFKLLTSKLSELAGGERIGFNQSVYLSEKSVAHRNYALAHFMEAEGGFPEKTDILDTVDFYFQMCSCEANSKSMASIAATFANNGKSPISAKKVVSSANVKHTLQLMYSCGMYDFSGEWACTVGLPAKSGVSGCIFAVIPGVLGISVYSPPLDPQGNSFRGVEFYKRFVSKFNWNLFDILYSQKE